MRLKDKGDVTPIQIGEIINKDKRTVQRVLKKLGDNNLPIQIGEIINKDKRTVQRVLKKLGDNNLIEWFGTSIKDPKKIYRIKN